ncbi:MAG: diaminopimelate decarboxylase [Oligoflexia bacterium]|nr:diaminopimelate decarboxylase [Oligoflexia bacterium]
MKSKLLTLAKKFGTPLYVYDLKHIYKNLSALQTAFNQNIQIHYAMKANNYSPLLKKLAQKQIGVDVVSMGEMSLALKSGFKPSKIIFSGVAKTEDEIRFAIKSGIFLLNVESPQELERIGKLSLKHRKMTDVGFRLNPDVNPHTHPYITTGFKENKFGMDKSFLPELVRILKKYNKSLNLISLGFHIGSQLTKIAPYEEAVKKSIPIYKNLLSKGFKLKHFDIGGGIGIPYQNEKTININQYATSIQKLLRPLNCQIHCEPGRLLVGEAGYLLTKVEYVKRTPFKNFVVVNTGMHHLIRPALYNAFHGVENLSRKNKRKIKVDIVGPICESSDFIAKNRLLSPPHQGDILVIYNVGAYGATMASYYNMHVYPKEILT